MRKRLFKIVLAMLVFSFLIIPLLQNGEVKAIAKEVKFACYLDLTGPIATTANGMWEGIQVSHEWQKKYDPIPGITIKLIWRDTSYSAPKFLTAFKKFKSEGMALALGMSSTGDAVLGPLHKKHKIPMFCSGGYSPVIIPPAYNFGIRPLYASYFAAAAIHFMENWKGKGITRKPRIMFITWDNAFGRGPIALGTPWAKEFGFEVLPSQFFTSSRPTDMTIQLSKAKELGADFVYMNSVAGHYAVLLKTAQKLDLLKRIQCCVGLAPGESELPRLAGTASERAWAISPYRAWPNESKGYKWIVKEFKRQGKALRGTDSAAGFSFMRIGTEAIRAAANKVGPENVDNHAIFDALCNMKNLDMWGILPNVSYAPDSRIPYSKMYVQEMRDEKWHDRALVDVPSFRTK